MMKKSQPKRIQREYFPNSFHLPIKLIRETKMRIDPNKRTMLIKIIFPTRDCFLNLIISVQDLSDCFFEELIEIIQQMFRWL